MTRRAGDPSLICMHVRALNDGDLPRLMELQSCVYESMADNEQFVFTGLDECSDSVQNDICIGVFRENSLIAGFILVANRDSDRNIGAEMGYDPLKSVTLDSIFIIPGCRGFGLQKYLISLSMEIAGEIGAEYAFATVSPANKYSLRNLEEKGFHSIYRGNMYGGFDRFVMMKNI